MPKSSRALFSTSCLVLLLILSSGLLMAEKSPPNGLMRLSLEGEWVFRQKGNEQWLEATVPGTVHTDLLDNGQIPDPYFRDNELKVKWIEDADWEYKKIFEVDKTLWDRERIELVCEGLDTFATIWINGSLLSRTDNMFRGYRFDARPLLRFGTNEIRILFESPVRREKILAGRHSYTLPGGGPHTRKAPFHFGWDWGPRLVTSGIWRPLYLEGWDGARIVEVLFEQEFREDSRVWIRFGVETEALTNLSAGLRMVISGKETKVIQEKVQILQGVHRHQAAVLIENPDLWWPSGMGDPHLYRVRIELSTDSGVIDTWEGQIGIRAMRLEQEKDAWGTCFRFSVNGRPFFAKGANWIPADVFLPRVSAEKYRALLQSCIAANMNMVRVWGGGVYEAEEFYNLCDELGIVVWQDFMFACALYPGDADYLQNVEKEAEYVIKKFRHHPCIALWCGNNECEEGWFHWGWKESLPAHVWSDYEKIFHQILPQAVQKYDPQRAYWPSSPHSKEIGDPRSEESGDMHYWGVWHGQEPFAEYQKKYHRFMSEFGFQSFPLLETVKTFTRPEDWNLASPVMEFHQKHPQGNKLILQYMLDFYRMPKDFESLLWLSQVLQAEGMKMAVEHFRSQRPRIMGSLYWQLNDCWPVASWSGLDYLGNWKALHHYARRFFCPVLIAPIAREENLDIFIVSDRAEAFKGKMSLSVLTYDGKILFEETMPLRILPDTSFKAFSRKIEDLRQGENSEKIFLYCQLSDEDKLLSSNIFHFSEMKKVDLPDPGIQARIVRHANRIKVQLTSARFAKDVYLSAHNMKGRFVSNFFDMLPGRTYTVEFLTEGQPDPLELEKSLTIRTLRDTY